MSAMIPPEIEALGVRDRVVVSLNRAVQLAARLTSRGAQEHMRYGLGRRLRLLHLGLAAIVGVAHVRRSRPLSDAEQLELTLHLNSFYLHIRGSLDNLAWCLAHEHRVFGSEVDEETVASRVNLFASPFVAKLEAVAPDVAGAIRRHAEWHADLKSIRDPVAHRIPIYAVPSVLTQEEADRYRSVYERGERARAAGKLDLAAKLLEELNLIGDYVPYFAHSPSASDKMRKVYPQVADDLAIVLDLADSVIAHLEHGRV